MDDLWIFLLSQAGQITRLTGAKQAVVQAVLLVSSSAISNSRRIISAASFREDNAHLLEDNPFYLNGAETK